MKFLGKHPNAIIGGVLGAGGIGQAVIAVLANYNVHLSERQSALVTAGVATAVLAAGRATKYVWRFGVIGAWKRVAYGKTGLSPDAVWASTGELADAQLQVAQLQVKQAELEQTIAEKDALIAQLQATAAPPQ